MKKTAILKLSAVALALVLLVAGVVGITAAATDGEASAELKIVTLNYGAELRLAYAYELTGVEPDKVEIRVYKDEALEGAYTTSQFSESYYSESYPVYYSSGVSAKDIADTLYAVPVLKSTGEAIGDANAYSVLKYCYDVIYNENSSSDLVLLAKELIEYGAAAQQRLINIGNIESETLVTDYVYLYTNAEGVTVNGKRSVLVKSGDTVTVASASYTSYKVVSEGGKVSYIYGGEASFVASENAKVELDLVERFEAEDPNIYFDGSNSASVFLSNNNANAEFSVVADPKNAANKVLRVRNTKATAGGQYHTNIYVNPASDLHAGNCVSFTTSVYFEEFANSGDAIVNLYLRSNATDKVTYTVKSAYNANTTATLSGPTGVIATVAPGVWYDIRIEAYTLSAHTVVQVYVGEKGGELALVEDYLINEAFEVTQAYFKQFGAKATGATLIDDVILEGIDKTLTSENIYAPDPEIAEGFEQGLTTTDKIATSGSSAITELEVTKDPTNADNSVLKVSGVKGTSSSNITTTLALSNPDAEGNCYVFEGRFYFEDLDSGESNDEIQISFNNGTAKFAAVGFGQSKDGAAVYLKERNNGTGGSGSNSTLALDGTELRFASEGWYTVRYELYLTGNSENCYAKVYIGSDGLQPVCVAEFECYYSTEAKSFTSLDSVKLVWQKYDTQYTLYADDLSFYKISKEFVSSAN